MTEKTYTETEVKALVAAALQRAAYRVDFGWGHNAGHVVRALITTDHAAALEAVKAQAVSEWRGVVSWLDSDEKTLFDWYAGGADPDGEFSRIGLRREMPDGTVLYRGYRATGPWEPPALRAGKVQP